MLFVHSSPATRVFKTVCAVLMVVSQSVCSEIILSFYSAPVDVGNSTGCNQIAIALVTIEYGQPLVRTAIQTRGADWAIHCTSRSV